jgi:glutamyl-tRNA reductase
MFENLSLEELNKVLEEATKRRDEMMATYRKNVKEELRAAWKKYRKLCPEDIYTPVFDYECECGRVEDIAFDLAYHIDKWLNT